MGTSFLRRRRVDRGDLVGELHGLSRLKSFKRRTSDIDRYLEPSLARFENKNIIFYFWKRSSLLQRWRKFKNCRIGSW
jgi:hypothetical protein